MRPALLVLPILLTLSLNCYAQDMGYYDQLIFNNIKGINPNNVAESCGDIAQLYYKRGVAYAAIADYGHAIVDFTKVIALNPTDPQDYSTLGHAYGPKSNYDQAVSDKSLSAKLTLLFKEAYYSRAIAYYLKEEYDMAWKDVHQADLLGLDVGQGFWRSTAFTTESTFLEALKNASEDTQRLKEENKPETILISVTPKPEDTSGTVSNNTAPAPEKNSEIVLKDGGQKIEGKIVERTDKYIKMDTGVGMLITYYLDEIDTIDGQKSDQ